MERGLLSRSELASSYGDVVWMYLFQDFSKSEADRTAERVAIRFGISSWPQHFLVDPRNLEVLGSTGRSLESFRVAVAGAKLRRGVDALSAEALADAEKLAAELEASTNSRLAKKHLDHSDVVVRYRAIQILAEKSPKTLVEHAAKLLAVPHDQTRGTVCDVLARLGDASARLALEALVRDPSPSRNPNVMRIRAVTALARCGSAESLAVIDPHAASGVFFNGLTGRAIETIVAIAKRHPKSGEAAREILSRAFPAPAEGERETRACVSLARRVHAALGAVTGKKIAFPDDYDESSRAALVAAWSK